MNPGPPDDPIVRALVDAGWKVIGQGRGYTRVRWLPNDHTSIRVPLDPAAPEYLTNLDNMRMELERAESRGNAARRALRRLQDGGLLP